MNQKYLVFKAVTAFGASIHVSQKALRTVYTCNKTYFAKHPNLPMFIATVDNMSGSGRLSVGSHYDKVLLVSVAKKDIRSGCPYANFYADDIFYQTDIEHIAKHVEVDTTGFVTAMKLRVIQEIPQNVNLKDYIHEAAEKFNIQVLTQKIAATLQPFKIV
jgi:hypothetical protein